MSTKCEHVTHRIYIRAGYKDNSSKDICVTAISVDDREAGVSLDDSTFLDPDEPYYDSIVDVTIPLPVRTQVAVAVWEGSKDEAGARKMRSQWIPLLVREAQ